MELYIEVHRNNLITALRGDSDEQISPEEFDRVVERWAEELLGLGYAGNIYVRSNWDHGDGSDWWRLIDPEQARYEDRPDAVYSDLLEQIEQALVDAQEALADAD